MNLCITEDKHPNNTQRKAFPKFNSTRAEIRFKAKAMMTSLQRDIYSDRPKHNIVIKFSLCVIDVFLMVSLQGSICSSIRDSKMESVAAKVLY